MAQSERVSWRVKAAYGSLALPLSTIGLPLSIYLAPFYAGELGLPLSLLGGAMLVARLLDVAVMPAIGHATDRWRPRLGRRRIWIPLGVAVLSVGVLKLFQPDPPIDLLYFLTWLTVVYIGFVMTQLPYHAWGGELSPDYHERTRIVSVRQLFSVGGLVVATAVPAFVLSRAEATAGDVLHGMSTAMLILLPLCAAVVFFTVPEPQLEEHGERIDFRKGLVILAGNAPFRRIAMVLFIGYVAETFRITITLFFARDVVGVPNIGLIYVYYFLTGLAAIPFWSWLGNRIGKHRAFCAALAVVIVSNVALFFLEYGQVAAFTAILMVKGLCFGALELLPAAMVADTADVDTLESGERRQGLFFAVMTVVITIGQAVGQGLSLNLLAVADYKSSGGNDADALFWLRALYSLFTSALLLVAVRLCWSYPLTAEAHGKIRREIAAREATAESATRVSAPSPHHPPAESHP